MSCQLILVIYWQNLQQKEQKKNRKGPQWQNGLKTLVDHSHYENLVFTPSRAVKKFVNMLIYWPVTFFKHSGFLRHPQADHLNVGVSEGIL